LYPKTTAKAMNSDGQVIIEPMPVEIVSDGWNRFFCR
jgi:hypothetical protein